MLYLRILIFLPLTCAKIADLTKNITLHLKYNKIKTICNNRLRFCDNNRQVICTMRFKDGVKEWKEFDNSCLIFVTNMCDYPGEEFHIASRGFCSDYIVVQRRHSLLATSNIKMTKSSTSKKLTTKKALRDSMSTLYEIDTAFDEHICPMSCPDIYTPVCVSINRNFGLHFKFLTFVNHCEADRYYCANWEEFSPPPEASIEKIQSAQLGWSFCGATRYLHFARFSEVVSSLGHYGWLAGEQGYSHIMEPHERMPGYG